VTTTPDGVVFQASPGETNHLLIAEGIGAYQIIDTGATIAAGSACMSVASNEAACPAARGSVLTVALGDLSDFASLSIEQRLHLDAETGNDVITANAAAFFGRIDAGPGNDTISARGVVLLGGDGNDALTGAGEAVLIGGPGADVLAADQNPSASVEVSYRDKTAAVTADDDSIADDGEAGEGDNVQIGIDSIVGGHGNDTLVSFGASLWGRQGNDRLVAGVGSQPMHFLGGDGDDVLRGGGSDDALEGRDGNDVIDSGAGDDFLIGGPGADHLAAGPGRDVVAGKRGDDVITGGSGSDDVFAGAGKDTLRMRDRRRDFVFGGPGRDRARVDRGLDRVELVENLF
jgi:Ca2+-binding RTX toxin-like protein